MITPADYPNCNQSLSSLRLLYSVQMVSFGHTAFCTFNILVAKEEPDVKITGMTFLVSVPRPKVILTFIQIGERRLHADRRDWLESQMKLV